MKCDKEEESEGWRGGKQDVKKTILYVTVFVCMGCVVGLLLLSVDINEPMNNEHCVLMSQHTCIICFIFVIVCVCVFMEQVGHIM